MAEGHRQHRRAGCSRWRSTPGKARRHSLAGVASVPAPGRLQCRRFFAALSAPMFGRPGCSPVFLVSEPPAGWWAASEPLVGAKNTSGRAAWTAHPASSSNERSPHRPRISGDPSSVCKMTSARTRRTPANVPKRSQIGVSRGARRRVLVGRQCRAPGPGSTRPDVQIGRCCLLNWSGKRRIRDLPDQKGASRRTWPD